MYLMEVLSALGYDSTASFAFITEDDLGDLCGDINEKINQLEKYPDDNYTKNLIGGELKSLWQEIGSFVIPPGHRNVIKLLLRFFGNECNATDRPSSSQALKQDKTVFGFPFVKTTRSSKCTPGTSAKFYCAKDKLKSRSVGLEANNPQKENISRSSASTRNQVYSFGSEATQDHRRLFDEPNDSPFQFGSSEPGASCIGYRLENVYESDE